MVEILLTLLGCAALLALVALYYRFTDPEVIDEEEEATVEAETPEERARARLEDEERLTRQPSANYDDSSQHFMDGHDSDTE